MSSDQSNEIARIAAAYPLEAANVPPSEREQYFSDIQQRHGSDASRRSTVAETDRRL